MGTESLVDTNSVSISLSRGINLRKFNVVQSYQSSILELFATRD